MIKNIEIFPILGFMGIFLLILLLSELTYRWISKDSELTRKISHIITGFVSLAIPSFFDGYLGVLILGLLSFLLLFLSKKARIFHSIHRLERKSYGAALLPIAIFLCYAAGEYLDNPIYFFTPVLILTVSDPLAGLFGRRIESMYWRNFGSIAATKTVAGSLAFFITALTILLLLIPRFYEFNFFPLIIISLCIAALSCLIEVISGNGTDNLTVPLAVIIMLLALNIWI